MRIDDRKHLIMDTLNTRRKTTIEELAVLCGVNERTIRRDIDDLTCFYPIETVRGRYDGGVKLSDWYTPGRKTLNAEQAELLKRMASTLQGHDLAVLSGILTQFAP